MSEGERTSSPPMLSWTTGLLERARELDPSAWAPPLLKHLGRRRDLSVALAFKELLAARKAVPDIDPTETKT
jgi:hypothetical protein